MLQTLILKLKNKYSTTLLLTIVLLIVASLYNYHNLISYRPQSTHQWRQSDCASITLNYYQLNTKLLQPEVHNLSSNEGTSGIAFTSEIPIYYYAIASLYKIFGPNESIFRILNTLIFLLGLIYLHKLTLLILNNKFWSIVIPLLFFTSPVLTYYGNSFITNPLALSFSIIGLYNFARFIKEQKIRFFILFIFLFIIASSLKITAFFSFIAIGVYMFIELIGNNNFIKHQHIFKTPLKNLALMVIPVAIILLWIVYAHIQNTQNKCYYFSTVTFPIWDLSLEQIKEVLKKINKLWLDQYFHKSILAFIGLQFIFIILNFKKLPIALKWFLGAITFEAITFILLQFWTFSDHDYYTIGLYIIPIAYTLTTFYLLKEFYDKIFSSLWLKIALTILLIFNIYYTKGQMHERYHGWRNNVADYIDLHTIEPYLREIGVNHTDTVVSIPDGTNVSLYLMNQRGWTEHVDQEFNKGEKRYFNADSAGVALSINKGAKYLILNGIDQLFTKPYLKPFCFNQKGKYNNVYIFDLQAKDSNFIVPAKIIKHQLLCNAETLSTDKKSFKNGDQEFEYGNTQTDKEYFSGNYSCKLNHSTPYGMTVKFKDIKAGDSFNLKVWCKNINGANGEIIAQFNGSNIVDENLIIETHKGWNQLETNIHIQEEYTDAELVIFLHNTEGDAYFDDFTITRFENIAP